jgi:hypothetical protein
MLHEAMPIRCQLNAAGMAALGVAIYSNWDGIVALFGRLGDAFRAFMNSEQMQEAGRIFNVFADAVAERFNALGQVFTTVGNVLKSVGRDALSTDITTSRLVAMLMHSIASSISGGIGTSITARMPRNATASA